MKNIKIIVLLSLIIFACDPKKKDKNKNIKSESLTTTTQIYDLANPVLSHSLPNILKEISGLTYFSDQELIAVNDEKGKFFVYNLTTKEITKTVEFGDSGDYEGVEVVGKTVYILSSNGLIIAYDLEKNTKTEIDCSQSEVDEYEGLGYDAQSNSLILAPKIMDGETTIFYYDLTNKKLNAQFEIAKKDIEKSDDGKDFKPSGIAVHPQTGLVYVLASAGKKMIVFSNEGKKIYQYNLDEGNLPQPEGICFAPNGNLFLSSEGKGGDAVIQQYILEN